MQRGRVYPQIPDYMFFPDFNPRNRAPQKCRWDFFSLPLGGLTFSTAYKLPTIDYTDLSLTYTDVVIVGSASITWTVTHRVNIPGTQVRITCKQIDSAGNGCSGYFDTLAMGVYWRLPSVTWTFPPGSVTNYGSSAIISMSWTPTPHGYP